LAFFGCYATTMTVPPVVFLFAILIAYHVKAFGNVRTRLPQFNYLTDKAHAPGIVRITV
jgi:hypothetical protein